MTNQNASDTAKTAAYLDKVAAEVKEIAKPKGGPQTTEGKAASSRNAYRHGLTAAIVVVEGEEKALYEQTLLDLRLDHRPRTAVEEHCVEQMAQAFWKQRRCAAIEKGLWDLALGIAPSTPILKMADAFLKGSTLSAALDKITRYQAEARRAYHQAAATIRKHQPYANAALEIDRKRAHAESGVIGLIGVDGVAAVRAAEIRNRVKINAEPEPNPVPETNSAPPSDAGKAAA